MRFTRNFAGMVLAALPPASLFAAQSYLVALGQPDAVLGLACYAGLIALVFFLFDGQSGLAPALMRLRHREGAIRSAYLVYRLAVMGLFLALLPLAWVLAERETATLLPFGAAALLLRLPFLDADLDRAELQPLGMGLQNLWMVPLAACTLAFGSIDALAAGHCALWSSLVLALGHWRLGTRERPRFQFTSSALADLGGIVAAQGLGQIYGRFILFVLGTAFAGALASLLVYAKQFFNAAGLVTAYLRRLELRRSGAPTMRLSLSGQGVVLVAGSVLIAFAAWRLGVPAWALLAVLAWQVLEKLSANAVYSFQLMNRHDLAFAGLLTVIALGLAGLGLAVTKDAVMIFLAGEALAFCAVLALWLGRDRFRPREALP